MSTQNDLKKPSEVNNNGQSSIQKPSLKPKPSFKERKETTFSQHVFTEIKPLSKHIQNLFIL